MFGRNSQARLRWIAFVVILLGITLYMVVLPTLDWYRDQTADKPMIVAIEDELTPNQEQQILAAKLAIFAIVTYVGAAVGSFLNVVAYCVPRGESFALRSSACPQCGTKISRLDNLPIVSYLRLGGKCRVCQAPIPIRYLWVELLGAGIFGTLFLWELITGAANVPGFHGYTYTGVVWIVLYTKWDVVGLYLVHTALLSTLMLFSLIELQRQHIPIRFATLVIVALSLTVMLVPELLPINFNDSVSVARGGSSSSAFGRVINTLSGIGAAILVAFVFVQLERYLRHIYQKFDEAESLAGIDATGFFASWILIGGIMGWQAVVVIASLWLIARLTTTGFWYIYRTAFIVSGTSLLFLVTWLHHPFWKRIFIAVGSLF